MSKNRRVPRPLHHRVSAVLLRMSVRASRGEYGEADGFSGEAFWSDMKEAVDELRDLIPTDELVMEDNFDPDFDLDNDDDV